MKIKHLFQTLLAGLLVLSACQTQPTANSALPRSIKNASKAAFAHTQGPYTGPVSLKIDTGLIKNTTGKILDLNPNQGRFQIQAVPNGPVVFSENLLLNQNKEQEWLRNFKAPNTSKRYIVHVAKQEPQQGKEGRVQLNLNGAWVIREKDFERGENEFETTGLLLNANNSLKIRLKGKAGSRITVTVVEAGEAGTILRRRGWEKDKDLTQADRVRNNDTNIFDPNDPSSLGGLQPYEGDLISTTAPNMAIGETEANGSRSQIYTGEVWVALQEPRTEKLQALLDRYPVELIGQDDFSGVGIAYLRLKLNEISFNTLVEDIQTLNTRGDAPALISARFSSVNTAKTLALALNLQLNATDLIYNLALHNPMQNQANQALEGTEENRSIKNNTSTPLPFLASIFWWLNQTHVREAWNYSGGHDVVVAVLDEQFGYIHDKTIELNYNTPTYPNLTQNIQGYPEFKSRVITAPANKKSYLILESLNVDDTQIINLIGSQDYPPSEPVRLAKDPGHGLFVSQVIASGFNDQKGIVGVAPYAKILPMNIAGGFEGKSGDFLMTTQLNRLLKEDAPVDVLNISTGRKTNFWDLYIWSTLPVSPPFIPLTIQIPVLSGISTLGMNVAVLQDRINKLTAQNKIVVASGGNDGMLNNAQTLEKNNIPSTLDNVIGVGAYQRNNSGFLERAVFNNGSLVGSNYGSSIDIWAPGKDILALGRAYNGSTIGYQDELVSENGTSYAAPQVAGVIALMKSWKKSLNTQEALNILRSSGEQLNSFNFSVTPNPVGLNALAAIKHPSINAKPYQNYTGTAQANGTVLLNGTTYTTKPNYLDLDPTIQVGTTITLSGWLRADNPNIPTNEIHLIGLSQGGAIAGPTFQPLQSIPTSGAIKLNSFEIDSHHYLAFPNSYNGATSNLDVDIYKWNPANNNFSLHHSIYANGPYDIEPFKIGTDSFLAIAEYNSNSTLAINSNIYKWNPTTQVFQWFQAILTSAATDWEFLSANNQHFLVVANFANSQGIFVTNSVLYQWNGSQFVTDANKVIQTHGARDWEHIEINGEHFLAVAEERTGTGAFHYSSRIFRWNGTGLELKATIASEGARDWESFKIGNRHFLALANRWKASGTNPQNQPSAIYEWKNNTFEKIQGMDIHALSFEHFEVNNNHYLMAATQDSNCNANQNCPSVSVLFKWDGTFFTEIPIQLNQPAIHWNFFNVGQTHYLAAVSDYFNPTTQSYNNLSQVYTFIP